MEAAKGILAVLATVFVVADCFFPFVKGEEIIRQIRLSESVCEKKLQACRLPVNSDIMISNVDLELRYVSDNINTLCKAILPSTICLRPYFVECDEFAHDHKKMLLSAAYICSTEGRALLVKTRKSRCYTQPSILRSVHDITMKCFFSNTGGNDLCQTQQRLVNCLVPAATQYCGEDVATLFREKYRRAFPDCDL
ncbi:hypothetical protein BsWGS_23403 [Bradybaena similaris]